MYKQNVVTTLQPNVAHPYSECGTSVERNMVHPYTECGTSIQWNMVTSVQQNVVHPYNGMWYIHTIECFPVIESSNVVNNGTIQIDLEDTMLRDKEQAEKATYCVVPLT